MITKIALSDLNQALIELEIVEPDVVQEENSILLYATSASPKLQTLLRQLDFYVTDDEHDLHVDTYYLDTIEHIANQIHAEYDQAPTDITPAPDKTYWGRFELSGDDDVDYNGSYLNCAIDAIRHHLRIPYRYEV